MDIAWIMGGFFIFLTLVYVVLAIFIPELVGIQGKVARKIEASHVDEATQNKDSK